MITETSPSYTKSEYGSICDLVEKRGIFLGPSKGISMRPMLKTGRDTVVIVKKTERLKPLDVALYRRGDQSVLHRVISVKEDGYVIRGDNCYSNEYVLEDNVVGVLTEYFKKNKRILCTDKKYLKYSERVVRTYPRRKKRYLFIQGFKRIIKRLLGRN